MIARIVKRRRGSAAVLLCVLLFSVISSIMVIFEAADRKTAITIAEASLELGGRSVLSCYDKALLQRYGILGYELDTDTVEQILWKAADDSLKTTRIGQCRVDSVDVEDAAFSLVDPEMMLKQIREISKLEAPADIVDAARHHMQNASSNMNEKKSLAERTKSAESRGHSEVDSRIQAAQGQEDEEAKKADAETTRVNFHRVKQSLEARKSSSSRDTEDAAGRTLTNGRIRSGLPSVAAGYGGRKAFAGETILSNGWEGFSGAAGDELALMTYINRQFQSKFEPDTGTEHFFQNEKEYILYGGFSDAENYRKAYRSIFAMREAMNIAYLYSDPGKRADTLAAAEALAPPPSPFAPAIQLLIISAWAAAESYNDMKNLENGNGVPMRKTAETWMTSLSGLLNSTGDTYLEIPGNSEMKYGKYLDILFLTIDNKTKTYRIMDLIQINMKGAVREDFILADHFTGFTMKASLRRGGHVRSVPGGSALVKMTHTYWSEGAGG